MSQKQSIHQNVQNLFLENPNHIYTTGDLVNLLNYEYGLDVKKEIITMVLIRLYRKGVIYKTPTQMTNGFYYSLKNKEQLNSIYNYYLLPYYFQNKEWLIGQIIKTKFDKIQNNKSLNINQIKELGFVKKYSFGFFENIKTQQFLALIIGFSMCDGSINRRLNKTRFFFRRKRDAQLFEKDFQDLFPLETFKIAPSSVGNSYFAEALKSSLLSKLLYYLGAPKGNKVFQPFLIPNWIYHGPNEIKRVFLSTVIGNEGLAPSNNRWRIQFVLSKSKEHVSNLIEFLNQIRAMLFHFGITTSHIQLRKQNGRQFHGRFYIKGKKNLRKFYKQFRFLYASEKQEVLDDLISRN